MLKIFKEVAKLLDWCEVGGAVSHLESVIFTIEVLTF